MKIEPAGERTWKFWCPGCDSAHVVSDAWAVDTVASTISPSVLVYSSKHLIDSELVGDALTAAENVTTSPQCHSFVTSGRIQYLDDSTHALAGQTVELPDWVDALERIPGAVMGEDVRVSEPPNVIVVDEVKRVACGNVTVKVNIGKFSFLRMPDEVKFADIPDLIQALHTAHDIAIEASRG